MIEDDIRALIEEHYHDPDARILLLSHVGKTLTDRGLWPPANDKRSLYDAANDTPGVEAVREDDAPAYIVIVREGERARADQAIDTHRKRSVLRQYPKALLLAFTLDIAEGQVMALKLGGKVTYQAGPVLEDGSIRVDDDLRLPGLDVFDLPSLGDASVVELDTNIRAWCDRHQVDPATLVRAPIKKAEPAAISSSAHGSALERLYAAQAPEIGARLIVPIDIALTLSRLP